MNRYLLLEPGRQTLENSIVASLVIPIMVSEGLQLLGLPPWAQVSAGAVVVIVLWLRYRRMMKKVVTPLPSNVRQGYPQLDPASVRTLVATYNVLKTESQAVDTLLPLLPNLERLHLVYGKGGAATPQVVVDRITRLRTAFPRIEVDPVPTGIEPLRLTETDQYVLRDLLSGIPLDEATRIDVTGGTAPMTVAVMRAAAAANHRVTYTMTNSDATIFEGLLELA